MLDLGDRNEDATIDCTFGTSAGGVPTTLAGSPAVSVYKANSVTQTTAGVTLTADFNSLTGLNHLRIDTSADAFYATANDYSAVITAGTVDGVSVVGTTIANFSIGNRNTGATLTADQVDDTRTWVLRQRGAALEADNIVRLPAAFTGTVAMDFSRVLNPGTGLSAITSIADAAAISPAIAISNSRLSQDRQHVLFDITTLTDSKTYRLLVTATTTDSQTLPGVGVLLCQDNP